MGHHLFKRGASVLPLRDGDVELVRHFLSLGAKDMGLAGLARSIESWEWQGPGVWVHVDTDALEAHPGVFDAAVRSVERLGDVVDVAYLKNELRRFGTQWQVPQRVRGVVDALDRLRKHVAS